MNLKPAVRSWIFFGACILIAAVIIRHDFGRFLPGSISTQIGHQREALGFAVIMCATIQWFRPWAARSRYEVPIVGVYGFALVLFGWWLLHSSLPADYSTFSESFFGAGVLAWYVQPRRPLGRGRWLTPVVFVFVVVFFNTSLVLDQAEDLVMIMLGPVAFDVFDRTILDRRATDQPRLRLAWCVALVMAWLVFWRLAAVVRPDLSGPIDYGIDFAYRSAEAYWGFLLVHVYFSYWLGRAWRGRPGWVSERVKTLTS
ncbi:MAG: hypothetical protein ABJA81_11630 [Nocardioidaceae bacterium]